MYYFYTESPKQSIDSFTMLQGNNDKLLDPLLCKIHPDCCLNILLKPLILLNINYYEKVCINPAYSAGISMQPAC